MSGHLLFTGFDFNPRGTNPPAKSSSASSLDVDAASGADTPLRPSDERRSLLEDLESSDEETKDGPAGSSHFGGVKADSDSLAAFSPLRSNVKESLNAARNKGQLGSELWWSLPCEILIHVAAFVGWRKTGSLCSPVCRRWRDMLLAEPLWRTFYREHFAEGSRWFLQDQAHLEAGTVAARTLFRNRHRRAIDLVFGELQTGWRWLRERLERDELGPEHLPRCRQVARKLAARGWTLLYDTLTLVMVEYMEEVGAELFPAGAASEARRLGEARVSKGGFPEAVALPAAEELLSQLLDAWKCARAWLRQLDAVFDGLNNAINIENRKWDAQHMSCRVLAHTPSVFEKGSITFRDVVLLRTGCRARRIQGALLLLAQRDPLDLSDAGLDVLLAAQNMLDQLDCRDDLTGGCTARGQAKLRKLFLQPLKQVASQRAFDARTGKVRMFGGERDLMYGPGSEGED